MSGISWFKNFHIAHRGLHSEEIDENSYEAFEAAIQENLAIECDVHLTKDNRVVIHHDKDTKRVMKESLIIEKHTLAELKNISHKKSKHPIMELSELLEMVQDKVPLLIEIKYSKKRGRALDREVARVLNFYEGRVAVQSFDPFSCLWLEKNFPNLKKGLLLDSDYEGVSSPVTKTFLKYAMILPWVKPDFIALNWQRDKEFFIQLLKHFSGLPFIAWTIKSKSTMVECRDSFDTIIFDNIDSIS